MTSIRTLGLVKGASTRQRPRRHMNGLEFVEELEDRNVLAFTVAPTMDGIQVTADNADNVITLSRSAVDPQVLSITEGTQVETVALSMPIFNVYVYGRAGDDVLRADESNGVFTSYSNNGTNTSRILLHLFGEADDDTMIGGGDNDTLDGGIGVNSFHGGTGTDKAIQTGNTDITVGTTSILIGGVSAPFSSIENVDIFGGNSGNRLDGSARTSGIVRLFGMDGDDVLISGGAEGELDGGNGIDTLVALGDSDFVLTDSKLTSIGTFTLVSVERAELYGGSGDNKIDAKGFSGSVKFDGGLGADDLLAGSGANSFIATGNQGDVVVYDTGSIEKTFLDVWLSEGGQFGSLGIPLDDQHAATGEVSSQRFDHGILYYNPNTGVLLAPFHLPSGAEGLFDEAYDSVRAEFLERFFYNGFIAERIYDTNDGLEIKFGDQSKHMGDAILLFAQEAAILQDAGYSPNGSENVLRIILHAFDQLETIAERALYNKSDRGFFVRDFVGYDAGNLQSNVGVTSDELRQGIPQSVFGNRIKSDFQTSADHIGEAAYTDAVLSVDQAAHLMSGWWAITKYSTASDNIDAAKEFTRRVMDYWISVNYQLPDIDGVPVKSARGQDARHTSGFLSHMADQVTGDGYFWRNSNNVTIHHLNSHEILNAVEETVRVYVDYVTAGLSAAARELFNWDPVDDISEAVKNAIPEGSIPITIPVWLLHNTLLTVINNPTNAFLIETAFTGEISLNQFIPPQIRAAFNQVSFDIPSSFNPGGSECLNEVRIENPFGDDAIFCTEFKFTPPSIDTKLVSLSSLIGQISIDVAGNNNLIDAYKRSLGLVLMAFDPDFVRIGARYESLAMADQNPEVSGEQPNVWAALLRPAVQRLESPSPSVVDTSREIIETGPFDLTGFEKNGPYSGEPQHWSSKNRWETSGADESTNGAFTEYNGIDQLSLNTLILSRNLSGNVVGSGPAVYTVPNRENPALTDLIVRGSASSDSIVLEHASGKSLEVIMNGVNYGEWTPTADIYVSAKSGNDEVVLSGAFSHGIHVFGEIGDDTLELHGHVSSDVSFSGGPGQDSLAVDEGDNEWFISGHGAGRVNENVVFSTTEDLLGGRDDDRFIFETDGRVEGMIDGGRGFDTIDFSGHGAIEVLIDGFGELDGFNGKTGPIGGGTLNINRVLGSDHEANDLLAGLSTLGATWNVELGGSWYEPLSGSRRLLFDGFNNLIGSADHDLFYIRAIGSSVSVNGEDGDDHFIVSSTAGINAYGHLDRLGGVLRVDGGRGDLNRLFVSDYSGGANLNSIVSHDSIVGMSQFAIEYKSTGGSFDIIHVTGANASKDTIAVTSTLRNGTTIVDTLGGSDDIFVGAEDAEFGDLDSIQGPLKIVAGLNSPDGVDHVYVFDGGSTNDNERFDYRVEPNSLFDLPNSLASQRIFAGIDFDSTLEYLRLEGTKDVNRFSVRPSAYTVFAIDGNDPCVEECVLGGGDFLQLDLNELPPDDEMEVANPMIRFTRIDEKGRQREGFWFFDPPHKDVEFENIEKFNFLDKVLVSDDAGEASVPEIDVISAVTLNSYSDLVKNFSPDPIIAFDVNDFGQADRSIFTYFTGMQYVAADINKDNRIDSDDVLVMLEQLRLRPGQFDVRADVNLDGKVNRLDLLAVLDRQGEEIVKRPVVGGVRTVAADLNCDGIDDIIAVSGANHVPTIQAFNGVTGQPMTAPQQLGDPSNQFGVYVAAGDFDGDGHVELTTSMERESERVTVWEFVDDHFEFSHDFSSGFGNDASSGVRVSSGDIDGDFIDEIIVSPGTGRDPEVRVFDGLGLQLQQISVSSDYGRGGLSTLAADLNGDGMDEILVLAGRRGGSLVSFVPGTDPVAIQVPATLLDALVTSADNLSPLSGVGRDMDGDGDDEFFFGQLSDGRSGKVQVFDWDEAVQELFFKDEFETDSNWTGDFLG